MTTTTLHFDEDKIWHEISQTGYDFDRELVLEMINCAVEKFLGADLETSALLGVEHDVEILEDAYGDINSPCGRLERTHGFIDLILAQGAEGTVLGVDWKTTGSPPDPQKRARYANSWQWKMYLAALGASHFEYRIISQKPVRAYTIQCAAGENNAEEVKLFIEGIWRIRRGLGDLPIWPQNRPAGCGAYARVCKYDRSCAEGTMPLAPFPHKDLSYSDAMNMLLCPEKARRLALDRLKGAGADETEDTVLGGAFHRGIAEVYRQAYGQL